MRSGTENVPGIAAFGEAVRIGSLAVRERYAYLSELRSYLVAEVEDKLTEITVIKPKANAPHIVNLVLPKIKSETMLHYLSSLGIYVSSGSACSSHGHATSRALSAFGVSAASADCSLRISLCSANTQAEIDALCAALDTGVRNLVRIHK